MFFMIISEFCYKAWLIRWCYRAPLIQKIKNTKCLIIYKFYNLNIILKFTRSIFCDKPFLLKIIFLLFEYFRKVNLMKPFICIINKQLFKTIILEYLKSIYVKKAKSKLLLFRHLTFWFDIIIFLLW